MTDPERRQEWVEALLACDRAVGGERYADYRARLDEGLAGVVPFPVRVASRRRRLALAALAAVLLVGSLLLWPGGETDGDRPRGTHVLVRLPPQPMEVGEPFRLELTADYIATATLGRPFMHNRETVYPLRVDRVLKSGPEPLLVEAAESPPPLFCCPSHDRPRYRTDDRLLVYLARRPDSGWEMLGARRVGEDFEATEMRDINRCLEVARAGWSNNPDLEYRKLLGQESGGLDAAACSALNRRPDPRAAGVLLDHLARMQREIQGPFPEPRPDGRWPDLLARFERLARLLAQLNEARGAEPVVGCGRELPRGRRDLAYAHVPELCRWADEPTRGNVNRQLLAEIRDPEAHPDDFLQATLALSRLSGRDAVAALAELIERRPISIRNSLAADALHRAQPSLGPEERGRSVEVWLSALLRVQPRDAPGTEEVAFVRSLVQPLLKAALSPEQGKRLRESSANSPAPWFRRELSPLVR